MPIDFKKALNVNDPKWDSVKSTYKKVETGAWKALDPIGKWSNKTAGRLGAESFWPTNLALEIDKAARILRTFTTNGAQVELNPNDPSSAAALAGGEDSVFVPPSAEASKNDKKGKKGKEKNYDDRKTQKVIRKISPKVLQKAQGLAIFTVFRTGFGFSGASGSGVVISRLPDGSWGPPSGLLIHTIGWGFLIGLDIYDVVLVLRTQKAVDAFKHPKFSLGGELSVTAGPVGNGAMIDSGIEAAPCWSYVKSKGFYAGVQLDGNIILKRDDENARFYGTPGVSVSDILNGNIVSPPAACIPLWQTIYAAEGRPQIMGTDRIPQGGTPGDLVMTEEDMKNASAAAEAENSQAGTAAGGGQSETQNHAVPSPVASGGLGSVSGSIRRVPPPFDGQSPMASSAPSASGGLPLSVPAPEPNTGIGATVQQGEQAPYDDLPPDYDFATTPVNAPGGKAIHDPIPADDGHDRRESNTAANDAPPSLEALTIGNESAEEEKERLRREYEARDSAAASNSASASNGDPPPLPGLDQVGGIPQQVEAMYSFDGEEEGDLPFQVGEVIHVLGKEDEMWWMGEIKGQNGSGKVRVGIFPANYTKAL
ncbi:DUF500-domain-containing protein [Violaceomyces palustris]|uniref:DUF500-domain-containing protein n=1 Tax=Violaceomyces palustris TaxID=1673888 RepID=A0ACD0P266_9BASI|nr:DUF500-domain-containing protein [Violaceomyces palustris]